LRYNRRCSWHRHKTKHNLFFVVWGTVYIKAAFAASRSSLSPHDKDKTEIGVSKVDKYQIFTTRPGEWHEFQTYKKPAIMIEIMYVEYDPEDIERGKIGGPLK